MKQIFFLLVGCLLGFSSCDTDFGVDDREIIADSSHEFICEPTASDVDVGELVTERYGEIQTRVGGTTYFDLPAYRGCPSETVYLFAVKDWYAEPPIAVKLYSPKGNTYYIPMVRSGNYQYRMLKLATAGRWYWRYVFALNKLPCEPDKGSYIKDNTWTHLEEGVVRVRWPFSDDACWIQTCGHGCNAHTFANGEYYAQDWACTSGTLGESFHSPVDGVVAKVVWAPTTYGNYVEIEQELGNERIRFRIAHLDEINCVQHQVVTAGQTLIGAVGSTGNSTGLHAHCSVFLVDEEGNEGNTAFEFVEECGE